MKKIRIAERIIGNFISIMCAFLKASNLCCKKHSFKAPKVVDKPSKVSYKLTFVYTLDKSFLSNKKLLHLKVSK